MGLKTENYMTKTGVLLPNAYAKIRTLVLNSDGTVFATFGIQQSRDLFLTYEPIETVSVHTHNVWDRKKPLEKVAYEAVKKEDYIVRDELTQTSVQKTDYNALFGWKDDIIL
jgi:hypothetical protein